jgi:hypothetical protein
MNGKMEAIIPVVRTRKYAVGIIFSFMPQKT